MSQLYDCDDCELGTHSELYMVHDSVWLCAGPAHILCVGCLEARLGRLLTTADFTSAPLNQHRGGPYPKSRRLCARLEIEPE